LSTDSFDQGSAGAIAAGCEQARRLGSLLEEEFKSLGAQDLPGFESLQAPKEAILATLADLVQRLTSAGAASSDGAGTPSPDLPDEAQWDEFQQLMSGCREAHRRNDILIRAKLETIRATLRILQNSENTASVEVYDRLGRMSGYRRGRGYEDA